MQFGYSECGSNKEDRAYNVLRVATVKWSIRVLPRINLPRFVAFELHQQHNNTTTTHNQLLQNAQVFQDEPIQLFFRTGFAEVLWLQEDAYPKHVLSSWDHLEDLQHLLGNAYR